MDDSDLLRDVLASWDEFYLHLPDGEYHGLGEMRASIRDAKRALLAKPAQGSEPHADANCGFPGSHYNR